MLLRLLPVPSPSQPSPPTILFTLPLPASPYTARALPLPPNLLAHRSLCLQEDIDCGNVLLGDKASWVSGIVDNVTFSLPHSTIAVQLVDGSSMEFDLTSECVSQLHRVVNEVQLSFAAAAAPPPLPPPTASPAESPRSSMSSDTSSSWSPSSPSSRRSPSSLLFSLFSPLLPNQAPASPRTAPPPHVAVHQQPARAHRRQARSLLVDAYRRHVLPVLKDRLPSAFLLWSIESETIVKMDEFSKLRDEITNLLASAGIDLDDVQPLQRYQSAASDSDSDPMSPAASMYDDASLAGVDSPQNFLLHIPPAHAVPVKQRIVYSTQLSRLTQLASRVGSITKLASRYEREEGKRRWLEQVDLTRDADKACRRAFSNGLLQPTASFNATPVRRSALYQSITAEDIERAASAALCPPTLADIVEMDSCSDMDGDADAELDLTSEPELVDDRSVLSPSPEPLPLTPVSDRNPVFEDSDDEDGSQPRRKLSFDGADDAPALIPSNSDDSLSDRSDWDCSDSDDAIVAPAPPKWDPKHLPPLPAPPAWAALEVF